jgi:hypothetical protein
VIGPTLCFCVTEWRRTSVGIKALTTLKDNGIAVPQHLSLIGFDDIPISRYTDPQLTTRFTALHIRRTRAHPAIRRDNALLLQRFTPPFAAQFIIFNAVVGCLPITTVWLPGR